MVNVGMMLVLTGLLLGFAFGLFVCIGGLKLWRLGKARIINIDADGRVIDITFRRVRKGTIPGKTRTVILDGDAKHGGRYSTWLVDMRTGWNYRAPTRKETVDSDPLMAVLAPSNPESYHRAIHRNRWTDIFRAGEDPDRKNIFVALAIIGLFALFAILAAVVYIISKLQSGAPGAAASVGA